MDPSRLSGVGRLPVPRESFLLQEQYACLSYAALKLFRQHGEAPRQIQFYPDAFLHHVDTPGDFLSDSGSRKKEPVAFPALVESYRADTELLADPAKSLLKPRARLIPTEVVRDIDDEGLGHPIILPNRIAN